MPARRPSARGTKGTDGVCSGAPFGQLHIAPPNVEKVPSGWPTQIPVTIASRSSKLQGCRNSTPPAIDDATTGLPTSRPTIAKARPSFTIRAAGSARTLSTPKDNIRRFASPALPTRGQKNQNSRPKRAGSHAPLRVAPVGRCALRVGDELEEGASREVHSGDEPVRGDQSGAIVDAYAMRDRERERIRAGRGDPAKQGWRAAIKCAARYRDRSRRCPHRWC